MKFLKKSILFILLAFATNTYAQLTVDAQIRPRFEYRHGYKTLFPDNTDPAAFVSQRTRLNFGYKMEKLNFYLGIQDVRVWGDVPQLNTEDENGLGLHQAWAEVFFTPEFSLKAGRQEIIYDDQRFFGSVGWAQQARSHDAAILKFQKNGLKADLGIAYNQDKEALTGNLLTTNTYKSLQYVWLHKDFKDLSASLLFLNNGLQYIDDQNPDNDETRFSQTVGTHLKHKINKLKLSSNLYYQFGSDKADNSISAYLVSLDANYPVSNKIGIGLGGELQSGNDNGAPSDGDNNAFTPLYGTNHKFNGFMDYFYVGNHVNNVGLLDLHAKASYAFNPKSKLKLALHYFSAAADISGTNSKELGTEIDLVYSYSMMESVNIMAGYSHMFPSMGMEIVKNNFDDNSNNWAWIMLTVDPVLFKWNPKKDDTTIN